jgi:phosphatidylglycerol---prolipoprotein diacylglyceryl transferase
VFAIAFPPLDPVALQFGPLVIRWYALAYLAGFILGWQYWLKLAATGPAQITRQHYDDFLTWAVLGVVLGGRIGYILFYQFSYYLAEPLDMLKVWHGGMSFHGGILGVVLATILFCRKHKLPILAFGDPLAASAPIGLFLGRLANFVNGELFGRPTDMPWGMIFPRGGEMPRHPSQLYEAGLEGALLFFLLFWLIKLPSIRRKPGTILGLFLIGYGLARITAECFREPDIQLGYLWGGATMGQILSLPMILLGLGLVVLAKKIPHDRPIP